MACKYKYNNQWYTKEEVFSLLLKKRNINSKGELIKPNISNPKLSKKFEVVNDWDINDDGSSKTIKRFNTKEEADEYIKNIQEFHEAAGYKYGVTETPFATNGIEPKITNETLKESIESVKRKANLLTTEYGEIDINEETLIQAEDSLNSLQKAKILFNDDSVNEYLVPNNKWFVEVEDNYPSAGFDTKKQAEDYLKDEIIKADNFVKQLKSKLKKEYTSQALINTKIAALKEVAKKYPRSLIRSEVIRQIDKADYNGVGNDLFDEEDMPFQKIPSIATKQEQNPEETLNLAEQKNHCKL